VDAEKEQENIKEASKNLIELNVLMNDLKTIKNTSKAYLIFK